MLKLGRHVLIAAFLVRAHHALGDSTTSDATAPPQSPPPPSTTTTTSSVTSTGATTHPTTSYSTCPSRTVNYITHRLPQQCLKSSWSATTPMTSSYDHDATISSPDAFSIPFVVTPKTAGAESDSKEKETAVESEGAAKPTEAGDPARDQADDRGTTETHKNEDGRDTTASDEAEAEADSPLDNANFLSFEEWKRQNLAKAGQSPENVGQGRGSHGGPVRKARPININNELDFLGEDAEINLDFGFGNNAKVDQAASVSTRKGGAEADASKEAPASYRPRSKDAGKTCKERFNYASFDCAATVLKTNAQCKSSSSVLVENKDSYMINECGAPNKFVIVELCDDILVDTIVLANFEFFSSQFRVFRVSVSDRYPVKLDRWKELGVFEARNSRDIQSFLVENPLIWARYLRIEFLSHYGNEYYCPVSLLRVHGTTMMEEFRHQEEAARGEDDMEEEVEIDSSAFEAIKPMPPESTSDQPVASQAEMAEKAGAAKESASDSTQHAVSTESTLAARGTESATEPWHTQSADTMASESNTKAAVAPSASTPSPTMETSSAGDSNTTGTASDHSARDKPDAVAAESAVHIKDSSASERSHSSSSTTPDASAGDTPSSTAGSAPASEARVAPSGEARQQQNASSHSSSARLSSPPSTDTAGGKQQTAPSSSTQPQPAAPTTQESFFKSIHKRLQMLESNSTLSLQYIEDQSRILRDAFAKVDKRQLGKTEKFLEHLNTTVMTELRGFRQQYDQLWQSTVIELDTQREQHEREVLAISARLTLLADELVFQKRLLVVQSTLILLCLGLVLFARSGSRYLELPLVQHMVHKGQSALRLQFVESPSSSPGPVAGRHRRDGDGEEGDERRGVRFFGAGWRPLSPGLCLSDGEGSGGGGGGGEGARSPVLEFEAPTPTSDDGDGDGDGDGGGDGDSGASTGPASGDANGVDEEDD